MSGPADAREPHEPLMRRAIALARAARERGNHPFGALLATGGEVLLEAENTVCTERDATRHAELNLVSQACRALSPQRLSDAILYASTEPCAMCCGALYWAGIRHVVYGCPGEVLERLAGGGLGARASEVFQRASERVTVFGPVLQAEATAVHEGFWRAGGVTPRA